MFNSPLETESELQWDPDSYPNYAYNCAPSSVEKAANYYKELKSYGIERTRDLVLSANRVGATVDQTSTMLMKRGIDNDAMHITPELVKNYIKSGRRPSVLILVMSHIPPSIKGNSFNGMHAVTALVNGIVGGETGIWVNEPNQRRSSTTYRKNRFFPDKYWFAAYKAAGSWAIVPLKDKPIVTRRPLVKNWVVTATVLNIRSAPTPTATDLGNFVNGARFKSNLIETAGGAYRVGAVLHRDWLGLIHNGRQVWVAKAYCKEA